MFALTRFLYQKDEVILSLVHSLLSKKNLYESYFWAFELFYSKENIFEIFWTIYFDFYAELNPKLESYMRKKQKDFMMYYQIADVAAIVRNLHQSQATDTVFMLRQYIQSSNCPTKLIKKKIPTWAAHHESIFHPWLISIENGFLENIAYYTNAIVNKWSSTTAFKHLMLYFSRHFGGIKSPEKLEQYWENRPAFNDTHALLATIINLRFSCKKNRQLFILPTNADISWIMQTKEPAVSPSKILSVYRAFPINKLIGAFKLERNNIDYKKAVYYNWEYYAAHTPIWIERFALHGGKLNHVKKTIEFSNDDNLEEFYKKYNYEFDEQLLHIQNKSIATIEPVDMFTWWKTMFNCLPRVNFPSTYILKY